MADSALSTPAKGPELNPTESESGPAGKDEGTRTEAEQKVPQAKPEWAWRECDHRRLVRVISAPVLESLAGLASMPR